MCSPLSFRAAQRTSTDSANRSESPACLDLSAQGRRHSESLTRTYIPSEHSCLGNPTSLYFSSRIRLSSHHDPQEMLNVSGIWFLEQKGQKVFPSGRRWIWVLPCDAWAGHSEDACLHPAPPLSSGRGGGSGGGKRDCTIEQD